ncbi:DUF1297 domain-containing protein [Candidatus Daviesbacteria bacterium]|nr:DUF1297 domain-containing protein [Candidatus Daviesbacteria bacterium]
MSKLKTTIQNLKLSDITIAVLGSHSALDVCRGAKDLGFKTLVIVQKGRDKTYAKYYKSNGEIGCVDEVIELENFKDILSEKVQKELLKRNAIFIPHRSFEVYINDYNAIEKKFKVPMFGNKFLLKCEERGTGNNVDQYKIMEEAGIRYPKQFKNPSEIDGPCVVKVMAKYLGFERGFFIVNSPETFYSRSQELIGQGRITQEALDRAILEEYLVGVQVNFNYFYSPLHKRVELIGTDTRRQTNAEGYTKVAPDDYKLVRDKYGITFEEAGHVSVTVLESLLEDAFAMGERFVKASQKLYKPGVIGPFGLQTIIIPGPPKKEIIVFDVSPRMPGSPGIFATPYSGYLYGKNISMGRRVAMEIKEAIEKGELRKILT